MYLQHLLRVHKSIHKSLNVDKKKLETWDIPSNVTGNDICDIVDCVVHNIATQISQKKNVKI